MTDTTIQTQEQAEDRQYPPEIKIKVAIAAIVGEKPATAIAEEYEVEYSNVNNWKEAALTAIVDKFLNAPRRGRLRNVGDGTRTSSVLASVDNILKSRGQGG